MFNFKTIIDILKRRVTEELKYVILMCNEYYIYYLFILNLCKIPICTIYSIYIYILVS